MKFNFGFRLDCFRLLKPNESQQNEALLAAMSEILWNIGEKMKVMVALPGDVPLIAHSHTYFQDSVTEKVNAHFKETLPNSILILLMIFQLFVFELAKLEDLQIFLKRYLFFVSKTSA